MLFLESDVTSSSQLEFKWNNAGEVLVFRQGAWGVFIFGNWSWKLFHTFKFHFTLNVLDYKTRNVWITLHILKTKESATKNIIISN